MSQLLFLDSFDHYSIGQLLRKWTSTFAGTGSIVAGRTGNGYLGGALNMPFKTLGAEYATLTAGVAYRTTSFANSILQFTNITNDVKAHLEHVGDGRLRLFFQGGGFGTTGPSSSFVMNLNQWYYFEMQVAITGTATFTGTARVNGSEILSWSLSGSSPVLKFASVGFVGPGGGNNCTIDDFYCTDDEYLGDIKIGVLYPNAAGDLSAWTPNAAGANYTKAMEHPADDDTTYNSAGSVGLTDLYNLDNIDPGFTGVVKGAQALWLTRKSDGGAGAIKGQWKSSGTTIEGAEYFPSDLSYLYDIQAARQSLFTAADWTKSEIDALQIGVKRTA